MKATKSNSAKATAKHATTTESIATMPVIPSSAPDVEAENSQNVDPGQIESDFTKELSAEEKAINNMRLAILTFGRSEKDAVLCFHNRINYSYEHFFSCVEAYPTIKGIGELQEVLAIIKDYSEPFSYNDNNEDLRFHSAHEIAEYIVDAFCNSSPFKESSRQRVIWVREQLDNSFFRISQLLASVPIENRHSYFSPSNFRALAERIHLFHCVSESFVV